MQAGEHAVDSLVGRRIALDAQDRAGQRRQSGLVADAAALPMTCSKDSCPQPRKLYRRCVTLFPPPVADLDLGLINRREVLTIP